MISTENGMDKLASFLDENTKKLMADLNSNKIEIQGKPSAIYFVWEEKQTDVACVACVPKGTKLKGWETWTVPAGKAVTLNTYGPDAGGMAAHNAIGDRMKANNQDQQFVIEEYIVDKSEKDSTKWQTNIYYILK
jgi:hypothetical protein